MELEKEAYNLLLANRRITAGRLYTIPSPTRYPYQWLWDSCFHAITMRYFELGAAKEELVSLTLHQFPNGNIPHMVYWERGNYWAHLKWGTDATSSMTQPPVFATAVRKVYDEKPDQDFLKNVFSTLERFHKYLLTYRTPEKNLLSIINPDESGEDNSPRFDTALGFKKIPTSSEQVKKRRILMARYKELNFDDKEFFKKYFDVIDLPFNAIFVKALEDFIYLAKEMKENKIANEYEKHKANVEKAMRKKLFDDGLYWSYDNRAKKLIKIKSYSQFMPLYAGLLSKAEAKKLIEKELLNTKTFWLKYPVPTISAKEPSFRPIAYWRGPVWISTNWFIFQGLLRYGYDDLATQLANKTAELIEKSGFREYYSPVDGRGGGTTQFGWSTLVVDMLRSKKVE